jgi:2'-5' RNA ligase
LRRHHFPAHRNVIPAHLTLFHALPGEDAPQIRRDLGALCRTQRPFQFQSTGLRSLGRGVAVAFSSPELVRLRQSLSREWHDWLTAQDSASIAPHVTIQNKVSPDEARALLRQLEPTFRPVTIRAEGLNLWRYLGGPWSLDRSFRFTG